MKVLEWLKLNPGRLVTVPGDASLEEIIRRLLSENCLRDVYVISAKKTIIGHLSHKRLAHLLLAEHRPDLTRRQLMERVSGGTAQEYMDACFVSAHPDESLDNVYDRQLEYEIEDMPVIDKQGNILGAINLTSILREIHKQTKY